MIDRILNFNTPFGTMTSAQREHTEGVCTLVCKRPSLVHAILHDGVISCTDLAKIVSTVLHGDGAKPTYFRKKLAKDTAAAVFAVVPESDARHFSLLLVWFV